MATPISAADDLGEILAVHGSVRVATFRKFYGVGFATGCRPQHTLGEVASTLDAGSIEKLLRDARVDTLEMKIRASGG